MHWIDPKSLPETSGVLDRVNVLSWLHIGDLHITDPGLENHRDLERIVALAAGLPSGSVDFVLLPGDNADDGTAAQFRLVRDALTPLKLPVHILPGDHDYKPRSLDAFHQVLGARPLSHAKTVGGHRCLFLDVVSAGTGGPDFRLGPDQLAWMEAELDPAEAAGMGVVVFMHTYPADLREGADRLGALLGRPHVLCVDMGHTHYNELANDGGTIFMATRSTGQIEEGPPGFSIAAVDSGGVSWRFKALHEAWPLVLITHPVERRLVTDVSRNAPGPFVARAKVFGDEPIETGEVQVDEGGSTPMAPCPGVAAAWQAECPAGESIAVRARDAQGRVDVDSVEPVSADWQAPQRQGNGSDADRVGAWPERGILDSQLGPNRNGRKW